MRRSSLHHAAISDLLDLIQSSIQEIDEFPDLQKIPTSYLGTEHLSSDLFEEKNQIFQDLAILRSELAKLSQRIDIPILVGVIGRYSSGKSSLLNAFLHHIYGEEPPEAIKRQVGATTVDTAFTYLTHPDFAGQFQKSKIIDVTAVDHDFFREINFIDTPGTGWEAFTKKEVSDLLSAADVMLFLFKPTEVLDALSVEALSIKIKNFPESETIYVITGADHYTYQLDWSTLDIRRFEEDLEAAHQKLKVRTCRDEEEREARNLVVGEIDFVVGQNTFLVDAKYRRRTQELLDHVKATYGTALKKDQKERMVDRQIHDRYRRFDSIVTQAEQHIRSLLNLLRQTSNNVIRNDVSKFKSTTLQGDAAALAQKAHSQISHNQIRVEGSRQKPSHEYDLLRSNETPELTLLQRHLEDLRQSGRREGFELNRKALLFHIRELDHEFDSLRMQLIRSIEKHLNSRWDSALTLKLSGEGAQESSRLEDEILELVDGLSVGDDATETSQERVDFLKAHFEDAALEAAGYYENPDIKRTIFKRHAELVESMSFNMPMTLESVLGHGVASTDSAKSHVQSSLTDLEKLANQSSSKLMSDAFSYLNDHVYLPTREALDFLFAESEVDIAPTSDAPLAQLVEHPTYHFESALKHQIIAAEIDQIQADFVTEIEAARTTWEAEGGRLAQDFNILTESSRKTSKRLKLLLKESHERIEHFRKLGVGQAGVVFENCRTHLRKLVRERRDLIEDTLASAKKTKRLKKQFDGLALLLGVLTPAVQIYFTYASSSSESFAIDSRFYLTIFTVTAGLAAAAWAIGSMRSHKATYERLLQSTYEQHRDKLTKEVDESLAKAQKETISLLKDQNESLRSGLKEQQDRIIETCEASNTTLLPSLDEQVKAAATLTFQTSRQLVEIEHRMIQRLLNSVHSHLSATCNEIENQFRQSFMTKVDQISSSYILRLEEHIGKYKNTFDRLSRIRREALAKEKELGAGRTF